MRRPERRDLRIEGRLVAVTPLLVPAYSSEVGFRQSLTGTLDDTLKAVLGPVLVSAHDVSLAGDLSLDRRLLDVRIPFVVLDSGGYELLERTRAGRAQEPPWSREAHRAAVARWPRSSLPTLVVSYDDEREPRSAIPRQIEAAEELFSDLPGAGRCMLLRTPTEEYLTLDDVRPHVDALAAFDVVGVTEKDIGASTVDRLRFVRGFRSALDARGFERPLHVFGGLDPFLGPSYLLAGADILDGLSWLRHAFHEGRTVDMQCLTAIERPDADFGRAAWGWRRGNLRKLDDLQVAMQRVAEGAPLREIGPLSDAIVALHRRAFPNDA